MKQQELMQAIARLEGKSKNEAVLDVFKDLVARAGASSRIELEETISRLFAELENGNGDREILDDLGRRILAADRWAGGIR